MKAIYEGEGTDRIGERRAGERETIKNAIKDNLISCIPSVHDGTYKLIGGRVCLSLYLKLNLSLSFFYPLMSITSPWSFSRLFSLSQSGLKHKSGRDAADKDKDKDN